MTVRSILDSKGHQVLSVEPDAKLAAAVKILGEQEDRRGAGDEPGPHRRHPVRARHRARAERARRRVLEEPVSAVMTRKVVSCRQSDTVAGIMEMMTLGKFRHLPVVEDGKVVGLISIGDIVKCRVQEYETEQEALHELHQDAPELFLASWAGAPARPRAAPECRSLPGSDSMARSAARAPWAIRSSARWKSNQPIWPTRGEINRSGGSPARRARVMRSCMMLKASTMTVEMPGRPAPPKNSRFMVRSAEKNLPKPRFGGAGSITSGVAATAAPGAGAVGIDRRGMGEDVAGEVGGDDDFRAERARRRYRHRIDQRAVDQPAVADQHGRKDPGQRVGGAHRIDHAAMGQPDLVTGTHFGRDRREFHRQILDQGLGPSRPRVAAASLSPPIRPEPLRRMSR